MIVEKTETKINGLNDETFLFYVPFYMSRWKIVTDFRETKKNNVDVNFEMWKYLFHEFTNCKPSMKWNYEKHVLMKFMFYFHRD